MVKEVFTYDVAREEQSEYLKATREKIKPYWEAHGCQSYQVWQAEGETTFVKEMLFPDLVAREKTMSMSDAESNSIRKLWHSFISGDFLCKTYIQKI